MRKIAICLLALLFCYLTLKAAHSYSLRQEASDVIAECGSLDFGTDVISSNGKGWIEILASWTIGLDSWYKANDIRTRCVLNNPSIRHIEAAHEMPGVRTIVVRGTVVSVDIAKAIGADARLYKRLPKNQL